MNEAVEKTRLHRLGQTGPVVLDADCISVQMNRDDPLFGMQAGVAQQIAESDGHQVRDGRNSYLFWRDHFNGHGLVSKQWLTTLHLMLNQPPERYWNETPMLRSPRQLQQRSYLLRSIGCIAPYALGHEQQFRLVLQAPG
ncbi:hypothetical protein D3C85_1105070 [compost metagenome]